MTCKYSYMFFLAFIVCLMPFSAYSFPDATCDELTIYKDNFTILKNATGSASSTGGLFLAAACFTNLYIMLINLENSKNMGYVSLLPTIAAGIIIGGLSGLSTGCNEVLQQFD